MTNTDTPPAQPPVMPRERPDAVDQVTAAAADRFVLESFETPDGENKDPITGESPVITMWGVFDTTQRHDGRLGMVWLPRQGFQADRDHDAAAVLLEQIRGEFIAEAMRGWDLVMGERPAVPDHQVIRLDNGDADRAPRLAQLVAQYDAVKREADAAAALLKEITDGIKAEARALHPRQTDFTVVSRNLAHPLTLQRVMSRRFDTAGAKQVLSTEQYDALCKDSESWVLKVKRG